MSTNKAKWQTKGEGNSVSYEWNEFAITKQPPARGVIGARAYWEAKHRGQTVKRDQDLQVAMEYCEQLGERLGG